MKQSSFLTFFLWIFCYPCFGVNIKVSDQYPTLVELSGRIEKISFGNGNKEYVSREEGRFLEIKAKHPCTTKTTITVFYLVNEGKKNEQLDVFYGTVSYDTAIQPMDDLKKVKESNQDITEPLGPTLREAIEYVYHEKPTIKRFHKAKQKVRCFLPNAISTGQSLVLKFVLRNEFNQLMGYINMPYPFGGIAQLCDKKVLARSTEKDLYWVNNQLFNTGVFKNNYLK